MRLDRVSVENFRSLEKIDVPVGPLTSLIGTNGAGKSAVLRAVAMFYDLLPDPTDEDWFARDLSREIRISLTFCDLSDSERESCSRYVGPDGRLRVASIYRIDGGQVRRTVHGYHFACPDFQGVRSADRGVRDAHNALADSGRFPGLPRVTRQDDVEAVLQAWERENPEACEWILDEGRFFGWRQVGGAKLADRTSAVYVPAVRDARDEAVQERGSALTQIVDLVLRTQLGARPELAELRQETQERFTEILQGSRSALDSLAEEVSKLVAELSPGSAVALDWRSMTARLPEWPGIEARLVEEGFESPVWAKGHGLQRSFIVGLLQHLAEIRARSRAGEEEEPIHTILLIEEPELYQHPLAVRRFAAVLRRLAENNTPTQVMYSTHHAEFIAFDHFDSVRRLSKSAGTTDAPPSTHVTSLSLESVADRLVDLWGLDPTVVTEETTRQRLRTVMSSNVSEGFFARAVVLVEGQQDQAMIEGFARARRLDLSGAGIAVLPVGGKWNLDRPFITFAGFGLPVYAVWDADRSDAKNREQHDRVNRVLLRLVGLPEEGSPDTQVGGRGTVFADKLETELAAALDEDYDALIGTCAEEVGLPAGRDLLKTVYGCERFASLVAASGKNVPVLDQLLARISALT